MRREQPWGVYSTGPGDAPDRLITSYATEQAARECAASMNRIAAAANRRAGREWRPLYFACHGNGTINGRDGQDAEMCAEAEADALRVTGLAPTPHRARKTPRTD